MLLRVTLPTILKTVWYWLKDRHMGQWNGKENSGIDSHNILTDVSQRCKSSSVEVLIIPSFSAKVMLQHLDICEQGMNLDLSLIPYLKLIQNGSQT